MCRSRGQVPTFECSKYTHFIIIFCVIITHPNLECARSVHAHILHCLIKCYNCLHHYSDSHSVCIQFQCLFTHSACKTYFSVENSNAYRAVAYATFLTIQSVLQTSRRMCTFVHYKNYMSSTIKTHSNMTFIHNVYNCSFVIHSHSNEHIESTLCIG